MTRAASLLLMGMLVASLATPAGAGPGPKGGAGAPGAPPGQTALTRRAGEAFCPTRTLVAGNVIIPAGQCFMLSILRDRTGSFLAFVPQGEKIPPGQLVRLNTPAGPKLRGRLFLIPLSSTVTVVPVNALTLVAAQIIELGTALRFVFTGISAPSIDVHER